MKFKKIIFDIFIIVAAFALFVLWYNNNEKVAIHTTAPPKQDYKIYLITKDKQYQYWKFINQGVADMSSYLGLSYIWASPEMVDAAEQINILNNAVENGADAIIISVIDVEALTDPIKNAKAKGVKIIYVDTPSNEEGIVTLATNNYEAGKLAAENLILELELAGFQKGSIGIVGLTETTTTTMLREEGFREVIKADARFTLLDTVYEGGEPVASQAAATRLIKEHEDLVGLFGTNEGSTEGIGNAIKADNNRIIGIGFDRSDANMKLLGEGSLAVIMDQNPYTMGYLGMAEAYAALNGFDTGPKYIDTGVTVIRKR